MNKFAEENPKWTNEDSEEAQFNDDIEDEYDEKVPRDDFVNSLPDLSGMYTEGGVIVPLRHDDIASGMCHEI